MSGLVDALFAALREGRWGGLFGISRYHLRCPWHVNLRFPFLVVFASRSSVAPSEAVARFPFPARARPISSLMLPNFSFSVFVAKCRPQDQTRDQGETLHQESPDWVVVLAFALNRSVKGVRPQRSCGPVLSGSFGLSAVEECETARRAGVRGSRLTSTSRSRHGCFTFSFGVTVDTEVTVACRFLSVQWQAVTRCSQSCWNFTATRDDDSGETHEMRQGEGGEQADPLLLMLCALKQHQASRSMQSRLRLHGRLMAFHDDVYAVAQQERIVEVHRILESSDNTMRSD